jgi:hypothetical protein
MRFHRPSVATVIATTALVITVGGGTAFAASQLAANSVGTRQLQDGAVTDAKIKRDTITTDRLTSGARAALKGDRGPVGPQGPQGPQGPSGSTTIMVSSLGSTWKNHSDGTEGNASINAQGAQLGGTGANGGLADGNDFAGIATNVLNGRTPADLSTITYTESYTMPSDSHDAEPYFKLKLQPAGGACGDDDVVYNPIVQKDNLSYAGETETFNVTAPYSTTGVNNDANPVDGAYPVAIHSASNGAGKDVSGERICLAEIILGAGGAGTADAKATVYDVTFAGRGLPTRTYAFGS